MIVTEDVKIATVLLIKTKMIALAHVSTNVTIVEVRLQQLSNVQHVKVSTVMQKNLITLPHVDTCL